MMFRVLLGHGFTAEPKGKPAAFCRRAADALGTLMVLAAIGQAAAQPAAADDPSARLLALVNAERAKAEQPALTLEPRLTVAACQHAIDLARGGPLEPP
jgi:uncharacterized protein YkwD